MIPAKRLIKKMLSNLEEQKQNINRFYTVAQHTITGLYRANNYADQITGILKKIDSLLAICDKLRPITQNTTPQNHKTTQYAQFLNTLSTELNLLKVTSEAMDDQLKKIKESGEIECKISGNLVGLKKQVNKTMRKVEAVLREN